MMRRRYRLFTFCAAVILFMLYRVTQNSWDDSSNYKTLKYEGVDTGSAHLAQYPAKVVDGSKWTDEKPQVVLESGSEKEGKAADVARDPQQAAAAIDGQDKKLKEMIKDTGKDTVKDTTKDTTKDTAKETVKDKFADAVAKPKPKPVEDDSELGAKIPELRLDDDAGYPSANKGVLGSANGLPSNDEIHWMNPPKGQSAPSLPKEDLPEWESGPEHFPYEKKVRLPEGKPHTLPRIQFDYKPDQLSAEKKAENLKWTERQGEVKAELLRAWKAYATHALGHDELSPVSGRFRDPFNGWSATLIDALDTMYVAGLGDEVDAVLDKVYSINFRRSDKDNIPVFETVIRYLGGLISAYEVSGQKHAKLLEKAHELAYMLLDIFDTPNHMPVLYYQWAPQYSSQPRRASTAGMAELATLSMEFTRLAQLSQMHEYYQGIDGITDALIELKKAGTVIPGLFPESLDVSGCNRSATDSWRVLSKEAQAQLQSPELEQLPTGYVPEEVQPASVTPEAPAELSLPHLEEGGFIVGKIKSEDSLPAAAQPKPEHPHQVTNEFVVGKIKTEEPLDKKPGGVAGADKSQDGPNEFVVGKIQTENQPIIQEQSPKAHSDSAKPGAAPIDASTPSNSKDYAVTQMHEDVGFISNADRQLSRRQFIPEPGQGGKYNRYPLAQIPSRLSAPFAANGNPSEWGCVPQGILPNSHSMQYFHMGGAQDSAYEYFLKTYILLGGLEPKYKDLYIDAVEAINKHLLYRPMIDDKDNKWDILFTAKMMTGAELNEHTQTDYEITHLTCFIGGMYAMGGKIFDRPQDVKIAQQLTDGCVWAYQSTPSGIMAEGLSILPCPTLEKCEFNRTLWYEKLDGSKNWRDKKVKEWEEQKVEHDKMVAALKAEEAPAEQRGAPDHYKETPEASKQLQEDAQGYVAADGLVNSRHFRKRGVIPPASLKSTIEFENGGSDLPESLKAKIGLQSEVKETEPASHALDDSPNHTEIAPHRADDVLEDETPFAVNSILEANRLPLEQPAAPIEPPKPTIPELPLRPESHEEFVASYLERTNYPPGVTSIHSSHYILRPEAIESVFYMYRLTGDNSWREKGWKMWQATLKATKTDLAHSAVSDVFTPKPSHKDEMESFWLAETLKYYYLLFGEPSEYSLDEWVFTTEAHLFKRPTEPFSKPQQL